MRWFGTCGLAWFVCLMAPIGAGAVDLALPASGIKAPYSPLAVPTRMVPLVDSMETLLNQHYHVITAHQAGGEEVLVLSREGKNAAAGSTVLCALTMPDPETDQNVVTSRCWSLNRPN